MAFQREFDELFNAILTDWRNQFPEVDTSQGSLIYLRSACLASAVWGLYHHQEWIARQIFPDTADPEYLQHHVWVRGLTPKAGETDEALLARLLEYIRRPPAGGNRYDYVTWAMDVPNVKAAYCLAPGAQGVGTVDVVIISDPLLTGSETPTQELIDAVHATIDVVRPVTAKYTRVLPPTFVPCDVSLIGSGANWNPVQAAANINAYLEDFVPDQVLYRAQLINLAVETGAEDVNLTVPAENVIPLAGQILRPGVIDAQ